MSTSKSTMRLTVKRRLAAMSPEAVVRASKAILARLLALPELIDAKVIALYYPTLREPGVTDVVRHVTGATVTFPRWDPATDAYEMAVVEDMQHDFVPGKFGILEPSMRCRIPTVPEREATVWLVPGLAFDAAGGRLGRGGGFYDRLLRCGKTKIGVAFSCQLVDRVPIRAHDVLMDMVVTDLTVLEREATMDNRK